ncbi:MAG: cyanophycin synthetase [Glaciecola sp.]|jgi:cyanophycin synthetase
MKILSKSVYLGPNHYALFRIIRLTLDLGVLEEWPTGRLGEDFHKALVERLPGLKEHGCSYGEPGGFLRRMEEDEGTWLGHVFEHVAIELQNMAGAHVTFGKTRGTGEPGEYNVVFEYEQEDVGLEAANLALALLHDLLPANLTPEEADSEFDWGTECDAFIRYAQRRAFGPSTDSLIKAAEERGIPWLRLNRYSLVQMGHGKYQRRIQATITSETRHISVELASDKEETNKLLGDLGLPVARQRVVYSADEAARAADRIGYPVVVKPLNANHGRGVSILLQDGDEVRNAFGHAREHSRSVLVESYIEGLDHRLLVVNGELIAASKRVPGHVIGDGKNSVEQLVEITNQDPRRGIGHEKILTRLELDHQAQRLLENLGYTAESVPSKGELVFLRSTGNLSTGGTAVDVTDEIHPDNREMARRAANAVGLDVCGVDFLTTDITQSYKRTRGAICELNAAPGFRMHVAPSEGTPRDVAGPVIDMLFPPGTPTRIPIAAITGTNGKTTTSRMVAHILKMAGRHVGLTSTEGVYIDGHLTVEGDMTGPVAARMVLRDPKVDTAVMETARGGLLRRGMGYRKCTVGAVLNVDSDHLGLKGIDTLEELSKVKRTIVEIATDTAVLNADDPLVLAMADHTKAKHVCYVTLNHSHPLVREHIQMGGRAVALEDGMGGQMLTLYDGPRHMPLLWSHQIPATMEGRAIHNVQNAMFAAAITFAMGAELDQIRHGLRTFDTTFFQAPGRMNVCDDHPFKVILDYGHNEAAVKVMADLVERIDPTGQRIVVIASPGDRRDEDVIAVAQAVAGKFDQYICRRDDNFRGRDGDEIPQLQRKALIEAGVSPETIELIPDEEEATDEALQRARAGDLVLIFGDNIPRCWNQITTFKPGTLEPGAPNEKRKAVMRPFETPDAPSVDKRRLVRDERGVRLAREQETSD